MAIPLMNLISSEFGSQLIPYSVAFLRFRVLCYFVIFYCSLSSYAMFSLLFIVSRHDGHFDLQVRVVLVQLLLGNFVWTWTFDFCRFGWLFETHI